MIAIGYSLSIITRFQDIDTYLRRMKFLKMRTKRTRFQDTGTYVFLIPLTLDRELIERLRVANVRGTLEEVLTRININIVEDHLMNLLILSTVRSRSGAAELAVLKRGDKRNVMSKAEIVVDLSMYTPLVESLLTYDPGGSFTRLVATVIRDEQSDDQARKDISGRFSDVLRRLLFVASNTGNVEMHAYEALRILDSINPVTSMASTCGGALSGCLK